MLEIIYALISVIIVSLVSLIGIFTIYMKMEKLQSIIGILVSFAVGALLGWPLALPMLAGVGISGAFLALITLGFKGALGRTVERYSASLTLSIAQRKIVFIEAQGKDASIQLPYAVAIAAGSLVVYLNELHIVNLW